MSTLEMIIIPVTRLQQNCTILYNPVSKKGVILDPGAEASTLLQIIAEKQLIIEQIWLTHGHFDHVGAAMEIKNALNIPIIGPHKDDTYLLSRVAEVALLFDVEGTFSNVVVDSYLQDGDILYCDDIPFLVSHVPGHTPGHVMFYNKQDQTLFCGDLLFRGSAGRTDLEGGSFQQLLDSLKTKILSLPDTVRFFPGHGLDGTIGEERLTNRFLKNL